MKTIPVTAQLLAPVAIRRERQSERSESTRSVAGTLVRGALASLYLQQHGQTGRAFERLFLNEAACRFGPLDPGQEIFPLTAASCKREGLRHALADLLWFRVAQHHTAGAGLPAKAESSWRRCVRCAADLKALDGFWQWQGDGGGLREMKGDRQQATAHVGIDRRTGTAAESMFYTLEAMEPSGAETDLYGWIMADDDAVHDLQCLLTKEDWRISVGHARTRGYGDVRLRLGEPVAAEDLQSQVGRWQQWSRGLNDVLAAPPLAVHDHSPDGFYFALSFPTGAVLVDRLLRYATDPAEMIDWLPPVSTVANAFPLLERPVRRLDDAGGALRWIAAVTRHEPLRGWNAAHGLPRQDEWAVARGSVYVYRFDGSAHERDAFFARLASLSKDGIGLRRNEGFGVVNVSADFHRRFHQQEAQQCMC